jgi:DNA-binding transcriptional MerR regulator
MARKYLRISEVTTICCVNEEFIRSLEKENLIRSVSRKDEKRYPLDQVDRIRVAHNLIGELGVNLEGVEVALHMREQIISMRRQIEGLLRRVEARSHETRR